MTKQWRAPRIIWVALPILVQMTQFFLHHVLSVTGSLICFRSLKSSISSPNIDTGFPGFFSRLIMTLTNMNINFFCANTECDEPRILKGGFQPIKMHDVYICYLRSNPILCTRLSKILQAYTSIQGDFKYKKSSRKTKNFAYSSMNFDLLFAEHDKCDFGLNHYLNSNRRESQVQEPAAFTVTILWYAKGNNTLYKTRMHRLQWHWGDSSYWRGMQCHQVWKTSPSCSCIAELRNPLWYASQPVPQVEKAYQAAHEDKL